MYFSIYQNSSKMIKAVVECTPDETLVKSLGFTSSQIKHQPNKGAVCNYLSKNPAIIGMVDADPDSAQPRFFQNCIIILKKFDVTVYQHNTQNTRLIVLNPDLEGWLIKSAKQSKINMNSFGLPNSSKTLHKEILQKLPKLEKLILALKTQKNPALQFLKRQLSYKFIN
jgi:hypothetical protein